MAYMNDLIRDTGLTWAITNGTVLHLCSAEPASYAGIAAVGLGSKTGLTLTGPADGASGGRALTLPEITDGTASATGTATYWALSNGSDTLVATGGLAAAKDVADGGTFTLAALELLTVADAS